MATKTQRFERLAQLVRDRRSVGKLGLPAPTIDEIVQLVDLALQAPDHKRLTPWRFALLDSVGVREAFGQALLCAGQNKAAAENKTLDEAAIAKLQNLPKRAPTILVAISDYKEHPKAPKFEQILSMGAAIEHILLGLTALGYQSIWRTGELMNRPEIKTFFGVEEHNDIAGFLYIGSSCVDLPPRSPRRVDDFLRILAPLDGL